MKLGIAKHKILMMACFTANNKIDKGDLEQKLVKVGMLA